MRHPPSVWTDPSYADEPLDALRLAYLDYLRGRAKPASADTVAKYNKTLLSVIRFLEDRGEAATVASLTPAAMNRWVQELGEALPKVAERAPKPP
jgi:site-specific recombinase XerD